MNVTPRNMVEALPPIERVREEHAKLAEAGVRYVFSCWIDMHGLPKTKPVPLSDFENLCMGKGPQFAVHSISFVPELGAADSDQIPVPDLDTLVICPWDRTCAPGCSRISGGRTRRTTSALARRSGARWATRRQRDSWGSPASSRSSS